MKIIFTNLKSFNIGKAFLIAYTLCCFYVAPGQVVEIPDPAFRACLQEDFPWVFDANGKLIISAANNETGVISCSGMGIKDVSGIEHFKKVSAITLSYNQISYIPKLYTTQLKVFKCFNNRLTKLPDISSFTTLFDLRCQNNFIDTLPDLQNLSLLQFLQCNNNQLKVLPDLSKNTKLQEIVCYNNLLTSIPDVSGLTSLTKVDLYKNKLTFEDFKTVVQHPSFETIFTIAPQDSIGNTIVKNIEGLNKYSIVLAIDDTVTDNVYKWFKNGSLYATTTENKLTFDPLSASDAGSYECLITNKNTTLSVLALNSRVTSLVNAPCLNTQNIRITVQAEDCEGPGRAYIDPASISGGSGPLSIELKTPSGQTLTPSASMFEGLLENNYDLILNDAGCTVTLKEKVRIPKIKDCKEITLSPNGDGVNDVYYIEDRELSKIYNRHGILVKQLQTPAYWDGLTDSGNYAQPGLYVIKVGDEKIIKISLVR